MKSKSSFLFISSCLWLISCSKQEQKPTDLVTFPLKGEVVAIDTVKHRLTVSHEEIPDYMMAMTMPFKVKNFDLLKSVQVGDTIQWVLAVSRTESWLEMFTVTGKGEPPSSELTEATILARVLKEGDSLPAVELTNQDAKKIYINNFKGKAVSITFIYTRCPLPDFCILMSNHFAKVQKSLSKDKSLDGKWQLMTISFDPKFDTPKVLKSYGESYGADFATWDFATADEVSIRKLADGLGLSMADDEGGLIAHNLRTVVLDKEGKIAKVINGNEWTPAEVVDEIKKLAIVN
ncbi:MAG: Electron transporter SenC [Bacteroidetes bacterium]|nr:Electron transporter SenC [Bacteroidota bacterium]